MEIMGHIYGGSGGDYGTLMEIMAHIDGGSGGDYGTLMEGQLKIMAH